MIPESFRVLAIARIVGGIGVGMASVLAPTYISEFSPARLRGRLAAVYQLSIVLGILAATVFFRRFVPETKGKTLEEIEAFWLA
jgi:MFS family permease